MIAIDTNIIVRFLTHDDAKQYKKAFKIFNSNEIFITDTVILETEWVLRFDYEYTPEDICNAFIGLFGLKKIHISDPTFISHTIEWHTTGADFADAMHLTRYQQYEKLYTFDKKFSRKAKGLTDCEVVLP